MKNQRLSSAKVSNPEYKSETLNICHFWITLEFILSIFTFSLQGLLCLDKFHLKTPVN